MDVTRKTVSGKVRLKLYKGFIGLYALPILVRALMEQGLVDAPKLHPGS